MTLARRRLPRDSASAAPDLAHPKPAPRVPATERQRARGGVRNRACRRPLEKPAKGEAQAERTARRRREEAITLLKKTEAKVRDHFCCRFPGCLISGRANVEAAHLRSAGMGGNQDGSRENQAACFVTLCANHHRGPISIHSGHYRFEFGPAGGDGPVYFQPTDLMTNGRERG